MAERPNVTVIYQDPKPDARMGCLELVIGAIVLGVFALIVGLWP